MGQTCLKSKQHWVFISAHQSPISSCFLGLRHTAGCVSISTASIIRQPTDDRTLETLLRRFGLLHTDDGALGCVSSFFNLAFNLFFFSFLSSVSFCLSCMHTTNTHSHSRIKTAKQARGCSSLGHYLPTFHPSASNLQRSNRQSLRPHFSSAAV